MRFTCGKPRTLDAIRAMPGMFKVAVAAGASVLLAACSPANGQVTPPDASRILSASVSQAQALTINMAQQELEKRCMAKAGFRFLISPPAAPSFTPNGDSNPLLVDTSPLRKTGYGIYQTVMSASRSSRRKAAADPNAAYLRSLSPAKQSSWNTIFHGTGQATVTLPDDSRLSFPVHGCYARALGELYGSAVRYYALQDYASNLMSRIGIQAGWSAAWQQAQARWRRCMAAHGYHYQNETAAELEIYSRYHAPGVNRASVHSYEMRVAIQDANCADVSGIAAAGRKGARQAAASFTEEQVNAVLTWHQMQAHALTIADKMLAQH
jgi:hypothetical protein